MIHPVSDSHLFLFKIFCIYCATTMNFSPNALSIFTVSSLSDLSFIADAMHNTICQPVIFSLLVSTCTFTFFTYTVDFFLVFLIGGLSNFIFLFLIVEFPALDFYHSFNSSFCSSHSFRNSFRLCDLKSTPVQLWKLFFNAAAPTSASWVSLPSLMAFL